MSFTIHVKMKKIGRQKHAGIAPVPFDLDEKPQTVRQLLDELTRLGVRQYNERRDDGRILAYLTRDEIAAQAVRGKVSSGLHSGADAVEDKAVENTLQCFEDGIYRVFAGEQELTTLSDEIPWTEDMVFTFIRLTMLSGW
ncbi:MAG: hypothetical protein K2N73_15650 [Lachnospiraceae bacterium]|nr:hypothetical protein [Lachnospiraceae bacterium]